jgi:hypothetical protein
MRTAPDFVIALLLSATLAAPMAAAQTTSADGDWEGTWRCEAVDGAGAFTSPAVATINGNRIKLSRAGDTSDVVLNGTIDASGAVTLTGRGAGPDGQPVLSSFTGTLSGRALTASGRAVPLSGGAVQTCALALAPIGAPAGPTVLRGSGAPAPDSAPAVPGAVEPTVDAYPYPSTIVWYDNDFYWRRQRLLRWEHWRRAHERHRHHQLPVCASGQVVSAGSCRTGPPNAVGPTPPPALGGWQATGATPPALAPVAPPPAAPQVMGPPRAAPRAGNPPAAPAVGATPPPTGTAQGARPASTPPAVGAPSASFGRSSAPAAPPQAAPPPRSSGGIGAPACSPGPGRRC